ncbi:hypothetical protein GCM10009828_075000 [Actinoplanes couchii]|uniref:VWFA domain-containing protein n=1 Tax=Actinoplanes couchii TaxID=403638 RepID=A0ABQ3X021_9ACTN|nr:hypothetical protein Aco03nite_001950 [Actinoplanes couchii]
MALLLAVLTGPVPARAEPGPPPSLEQVYATLGIDSVPADHVVLVDVSGSMRGARYTSLRKSLTGWFAALAPEDFVTLIPFDGTAKATTRKVGREPAELAAGLPKDATGQGTDIGAALEVAVTALSRPGAPPLATVVLLTDGQHEPGPRSAYPLTQGHNWNVLAGRAAALDKISLEAYAVPLSGSTGAGLLKKVFPAARVLAPASVDKLTAQLTRPKDAARQAKARSLLAEEITLPVAVSWPVTASGEGRSIAVVRLESPMPHVPLILENLAVTSDNADVAVSVPAGVIELPPNRDVTVPVRLDWNAGPVSTAPFKSVDDLVTLRLTGIVSSPWAPVLTGDLGLTPAFTLAGTPGERELSAERGSLWRWLGALLLLAALLLPALRWRQRRLTPALTGSVLIERAGNSAHELPLAGRSMPLTADTGVPGAGEIVATRAGVGSSVVRLRITYSPDGSTAGRRSATIEPGTTASVAGTFFTWQPGR